MNTIYKITNDINNKIYIGQTTRDLNIRWKEHCRNGLNCHRNYPLYQAMYKYGISHFRIESLEKVDDSNVDEREKYWINYYQSYQKGYNATKGGKGYKTPSPTTKKHYSLGRCKPVWQIDKDTNIKINYFVSATEAARQVVPEKNARLARSNIGMVCNGKRITAFGYKWEWVVFNEHNPCESQ